MLSALVSTAGINKSSVPVAVAGTEENNVNAVAKIITYFFISLNFLLQNYCHLQMPAIPKNGVFKHIGGAFYLLYSSM